MVAMLPLVLGFVFMVTAWTYCLRGWLVTLMMNPRRRRAVIAGITFAFILLVQLPNFLGNVVFDRKHERPKSSETVPSDEPGDSAATTRDKVVVGGALLTAHKFVPFLWVGNGAMALASGSAWPAVLGAVGLSGLGALGLRRAYRSTLCFYQGRTRIEKARRRPKAQRTASPSTFLERRLPGVSDDAAALALTFFRSLSRASEVKIMLGANLILLLFFGAMILLRRSSAVADDMKPFFATGAVVFTFFGLVQLMFNSFGLDRGGFRVLVLLPVPRRQILLGKNLAFLPIAAGIGLTLLVLVKFALHISLVVILAALLQLVAAFFLLSMLGNLASILVPHRVAPGSLKPTKTSAVTTFLILITRLLFPIAMLPIFAAPVMGLLLSRVGWLPAAPANLVVSAIVLGLLALLYRLSLDRLGDLLQRREKQILDIVTHAVE